MLGLLKALNKKLSAGLDENSKNWLYFITFYIVLFYLGGVVVYCCYRFTVFTLMLFEKCQ